MEMMRNLESWTKDYSLVALRIYRRVPFAGAGGHLRDQFLRAATSVGANYREASRSRSQREYRSKLGICLQELEEALYWLDLLVEGGFLDARQAESAYSETRELLKVLSTCRSRARPVT